MAVRAELGQDCGSGLNGPCKAGSCVFMKPVAQAVVVLRAGVIISCSCLGRPGKLGSEGLTPLPCSYVSAMVPVKSPREYYVQQEVIVLFCETVER